MQKVTINELNGELFNSIKLLQSREIDTETARAIMMLAQTMINAAKVEVDFIRVTGGDGTGFFPEIEDPWLEAGREPKRIGGSVEKQHTPVSANPFEGLTFTPTQKEILNYLLENGGESRIGALVLDKRYMTMKALARLEEKGVIVCLDRAKDLRFTPGKAEHTHEDALYCGTWKLTKMPDTSLKLVSTKKTA